MTVTHSPAGSGTRERPPVTQVVPRTGRLLPLGLDEVRITGGFWGERQRRNRLASLPHILSWLDKSGWAGNFDGVAAGQPAADRRGREFSDSEIYKTLEALVWQLAVAPDPDLERAYHSLVDRVAAAQAPDGYLDTAFGRPGQPARYTDFAWGHELYVQGHLLQASAARARTGHDDLLVTVGRRVADHLVAEFGPDGRQAICGHPEIELGLVEFGRATGEQRYIELATWFIDRRGHGLLGDIEFGRAYFQDDVPFRDGTSLRGHAVRALYLTASAVDVAVENGDDELLEAAARQYRHAVARRTYLTGGMGSRHQDEGFGEDWSLPPDRSYNETCASVASVMTAWRLLLATGEVGYADQIERTLYNMLATSPAVDGRAFFYSNTLHQRVPGVPADPDSQSPRAATALRSPWFDVSCCPPNVARTLAGLGSYLATKDADGVQIHQPADCDIRTVLPDGRPVEVQVRTEYPHRGRITVRSVGRSIGEWTLTLRVPAGTQGGARVSTPEGSSEHPPGTVSVTRSFEPGDEVVLDVPIAPRWVSADPRIDAVRGCLAVVRGPVVHCVESVDLPDGADVGDLVVDPSDPPTDGPDGSVRVAGSLLAHPESAPDWPYDPTVDRRPPTGPPVEVTLVPYHSWGNRGPGTMRVWLPREV